MVTTISSSLSPAVLVHLFLSAGILHDWSFACHFYRQDTASSRSFAESIHGGIDTRRNTASTVRETGQCQHRSLLLGGDRGVDVRGPLCRHRGCHQQYRVIHIYFYTPDVRFYVRRPCEPANVTGFLIENRPFYKSSAKK